MKNIFFFRKEINFILLKDIFEICSRRYSENLNKKIAACIITHDDIVDAANLFITKLIDKFDENEKLHFTWIGSIDGRKALIILLEALLLVDKRSKISIDIIGDGPLKEDLMDFARKHRIEDCLNWHGNIPRSQVFEILGKSRLNIITSLSEGNPTTIWESMSLGVPTLTLDHCGMHDTICSNCGIKLNIESYRQVVSALASELDRLSANSSELKRLALGAYSCSKTFSWDLREEMFQQYYDIAINNWKALKN